MDLSTVLIADAHGLLRRQRSSVLAEQNDLPVVGAATHGRQLRNRGEALQPHVLLLKLRLPEIDWLAMLLKIRAKNPRMKILILADFCDEAFVTRALQHGI